MDNPEEEDPRRLRRPAVVATQHPDSESSPVLDYFSDLEPLNSLGSLLQAGHPGPEREALTVDDVKLLLGSPWTEQAMEEHPFERFDSFPDVYQDWHQRRSFNSQISEEAHSHHHAPGQQLDFDTVMPCRSSTPRIHDYYTGHNHAGYSSGVPPPSLLNQGPPLLSNGGPRESSSCQQISDASKMPLQYPCDQEQFIKKPEDSKSSPRNLSHPILSNGGLRESSSGQQISDASNMPLQYPGEQKQLIQMPEDSKSSFVLSIPNLEVSNLAGNGQHGDGATTTLKSWSNGNASKSQDHNGVAEPNSVTPRSGRRKEANAIENGSIIKCKCNRSRCLKLYCECFAAGFYCIESCACKDCYNNLDFEDLVLERRRQIESRYPLAFGPKVVQHAINSPPDKVEGGGSEATPSSARHKRGCNCKKSHCLKKYCECYQAKAGCFHECNCSDCCNPFRAKSAEQRIKRGEMTPPEKLDSTQDTPNSTETGTGSQSASAQEGTVNTHNCTPSSSPLACSNHRNTRGCSSSAQAKRRQGTVPLHLPGSPVKTPPSHRDVVSHDLVSVSPARDMAKGAKISAMDKSSLPKPANAGSTKQRQVSTPQFQSPGRRPNISPSSRRARKPDSQTRPTPDGKSKGSSSEA